MENEDLNEEKTKQKFEYRSDRYNPREDAGYYSSGKVWDRSPNDRVRAPENVFTTGYGRTRAIF